MLPKAQGLPYLQLIKSLPVDFRLVGSREPSSIGKAEALNISKTEMISESISENSELAGGGVGNKIARNEDESPYSSVNLALEEENFTCDESLGFAADPLRHNESKWNDTSYYVAKKVISSFI